MIVDSKMMKEMDYIPSKSLLLVKYNDGKVWSYSGVRKEIWELLIEIMVANKLPNVTGVSLGRAFHYLIKIHPVLYPASVTALADANFVTYNPDSPDGS